MMKKTLVFLLSLGCWLSLAQAQSRHSPSSRFPTYEGRVMCGYQGWFRADGDGSGEGWSHYSEHGAFTAATLHPDFWPDVSEYEKTYPTPLTNRDGTAVRVFSSVDQSTTDLHFQWMQEYGIDGVFMQRFFGGLRTADRRKKSRGVRVHAGKSSQNYGRAISVMYDLSGLRNNGAGCSGIIRPWKEAVGGLQVTC